MVVLVLITFINVEYHYLVVILVSITHSANVTSINTTLSSNNTVIILQQMFMVVSFIYTTQAISGLTVPKVVLDYLLYQMVTIVVGGGYPIIVSLANTNTGRAHMGLLLSVAVVTTDVWGRVIISIYHTSIAIDPHKYHLVSSLSHMVVQTITHLIIIH